MDPVRGFQSSILEYLHLARQGVTEQGGSESVGENGDKDSGREGKKEDKKGGRRGKEKKLSAAEAEQ